MKIERLSENQIRCTLNKADLAGKEMLLNELAYGTDKAKALFRDMMQQASSELGFEVDDIPLMIEAIPVSPECLILIITKVEDPDELDTRFSRFSKPTQYDEDEEENSEEYDETNLLDGADSILNAIEDIVEDIDAAAKANSAGEFLSLPDALKFTKAQINKAKEQRKEDYDVYKIYAFPSITEVTKVADLLANLYDGDNSLYKNPVTKQYFLILNRSNHTPDVFNRVCNILSEYGARVKTTYAMPYYFREHYTLIIGKDALQTLASI